MGYIVRILRTGTYEYEVDDARSEVAAEDLALRLARDSEPGEIAPVEEEFEVIEVAEADTI